MKLRFKTIIYSTSFILIFTSIILAAIGQSAIITLSFPFGARSTGLGETFTGIADNVDATWYNTAGLGQSPLANTWKVYYPDKNVTYTAITSMQKRGFGKKERIWLGTNKKGLMLYNGKVWTTYDTHLIEEDDELRDIAEKFLDVDDNEMITRAIRILKEMNEIETNRYREIKKILTSHLLDSLRSSRDSTTIVETITSSILELDEFNQNATQVYGIIASKVDTSVADSIADEMVKAFTLKDTKFSDLVEIKVPFSIAVRDSITTLALDESERLWVGTQFGLWRYNGASWSYYSMLDGLPSNNIIDIAIGPKYAIAIATDMGIGIFSEGEWKSIGIEDGLPHSIITTLTFGQEDDILFAGTAHGLVKKNKDELTVFDTADGLLSSSISSLLFDSENKLWIGGKNGITIYDEISWKRYKFPDSEVYSFAEYKQGRVWIGTNKGAISYRAGRTKVGDDGQKIQKPPKWKPFHSKNALIGNVVKDITIHGKDIWLITDEAVNQFDRGDMQVTIFYEPLLPAFDIPELWHTNIAGVFPTEEWGTIGFYMNYLNFGENIHYDAHGRELNRFNSYEYVLALCYGLPIKENLSFGLNIKYAHSALAPGIGEGSEGVGKTFAVDASILRRNLLIKNLSLGLNIMNMGPSVFYIDKNEADPIPFTLRFGLAYSIVQTPIHHLQVGLDVDREIVKNEPYKNPYPFWKAIYYELFNDPDEDWKEELKQFILHVGVEYWYVYFLALRVGVMIDEAGSRRELSFGLGLRYGNMSVDWSYIYSPRWSIARDGQWRFSFIFSQ